MYLLFGRRAILSSVPLWLIYFIHRYFVFYRCGPPLAIRLDSSTYRETEARSLFSLVQVQYNLTRLTFISLNNIYSFASTNLSFIVTR